MRKVEIKQVLDELRDGKRYWKPEDGLDNLFKMTEPMDGCGLPSFPKGKMVPKESIVEFLHWQCVCLNGTIDFEALQECVEILMVQKIVMV